MVTPRANAGCGLKHNEDYTLQNPNRHPACERGVRIETRKFAPNARKYDSHPACERGVRIETQ